MILNFTDSILVYHSIEIPQDLILTNFLEFHLNLVRKILSNLNVFLKYYESNP